MVPKAVWVIDGAFVMEPYLGGQLLGELPNFDLTGMEVTHLKQAEFDRMMEEFHQEHGHYPDT